MFFFCHPPMAQLNWGDKPQKGNRLTERFNRQGDSSSSWTQTSDRNEPGKEL